jgi:hypothetical protein
LIDRHGSEVGVPMDTLGVGFQPRTIEHGFLREWLSLGGSI